MTYIQAYVLGTLLDLLNAAHLRGALRTHPDRARFSPHPRLPIFSQRAYSRAVGFPTIVINAIWNRLHGPGGSTRRLHHNPRISGAIIERVPYGGEPGST